jgi:hypothetical protein
MQCRAYFKEHGSVPEALTPTVLSETTGISESEAESLTYFKNPFSGDWVRCREANPSPGNIYCRPLSSDEVRHVARQEDLLAMILRGESPHGSGAVKLDGEVWYVRIYGKEGTVVFAGVDYAWLTTR